MWCRTIFFAGLSVAVSADEEPFSFVVMADIHGFTWLSFKPFDTYPTHWIEHERILKNIKDISGGEFVVMPGDSTSYGPMSNAKIASKLLKLTWTDFSEMDRAADHIFLTHQSVS